MKNLLSIFISTLLSLSVSAGIKTSQDSLKRVSHIVTAAESQNIMTEGASTTSQHIDWPRSYTGSQAMLVINWAGIPPEDIADVNVKLSNDIDPIQVSTITTGVPQTWIFLPCKTKEVTLDHPRYGSTRIFLSSMMDKDVWTVPVMMDTPMNIQLNPATDYGKSVRAKLIFSESRKEETKMTPAIFEKVVPGTYDVEFAVDGRIHSGKITVTPTKTVFGNESFDFRNFKNVTIESTEKAMIYIDDIPQGEHTVISSRLPYGSHTIKAVINNNRKDERLVEVNNESETTIYLSPIETRTFEVVGLFNGTPVETTVNVPRLEGFTYDSTPRKTHTFTLPAIGAKPYTYYLYYNGRSAKKSISVTPGMATVHELKFKADRNVVWPWQRDYSPAKHGWEFSWVSKQYSTSGYMSDDDNVKTTMKENGVWDNGSDHWLHGIRTGYHAQPSFKFGLGLYTGIFIEAYFSSSDEGIGDFDKYFELDMSIPLHLLYQFPLGNKFCIGFHTGPSFNWAMHGRYYDKFLPNQNDNDNEEDYTDFWDEPWAPKRVNFTWDFGLFIRWKALSISGIISKGLTDNKMHSDLWRDSRTVMNKRIAGISLVF